MFLKPIGQWLSKATKYLLTTISTIIIGAFLKGDDLKGLAWGKKLIIILQMGVPLWSLLLTIGLCVHFITAWLNSRKHSKDEPKTGAGGLVSFQDSFHSFDYQPFLQSDELLIVFNDGKSWIAGRREEIQSRILKRGQRLRVLLLHPKSDFLKVLDRKTDKLPGQQIIDLYESFRIVSALRKIRPDLVEVRGHYLFNPYILFLTADEALVHPFFLMNHGDLPTVTFRKAGERSMYEQYKADAEALWASAPSILEDDFPAPLSLSAAGTT